MTPRTPTRREWFAMIASAAEHAAMAALELRDREHPADDGDLCQLAADIGRAMAAREARIDDAGGTLCEVREEVVDHFATVAVGRDSTYGPFGDVTSDFTIALRIIDSFLERRLEETRATEATP